MLLNAKSFAGYNVDASDGPVGTVIDSGWIHPQSASRAVHRTTRTHRCRADMRPPCIGTTSGRNTGASSR